MTPDVRPGAIVCTYIATISPPKDKLALIAHIDAERDSAALFLIHSELPKFVQDNPKLVRGVTKIFIEHHPFLEFDSWLRFGDVHACAYSYLLRRVASAERCFCGYASPELLARLIELIPNSPELSPRWQRRYCAALRDALTVITTSEK